MTSAGLSTVTNQIACKRCGDPITDWMEKRRYGFWDADDQTYQSHGGIEEYLCRGCWQDDEGRTNGAHYWPESTSELFDVLDAADGRLAAILTWWTGRPSIRVVDGEPEAAVTRPRRGGETEDGTPILTFETEVIEDFDRDEFNDIASVPDEQNLVLLRDPSQTAFVGIEGGGDDGE